jgi:hypothetical protein
MKLVIAFALQLLLLGCTSLQVRQSSTPELRERYIRVERELATYHPEENDQMRLRRFRHLTEESQSIEHELFRRYRAGDPAASLPHFHLIAGDI